MKIAFRTFLAVSCISISTATWGQSIADGLRMSETYNRGTARFTAMGGAFGSIGSDFSSIAINPAGLGAYKSSEFTFTPSFSSSKINSIYNSTSANDTKNQMGVDNLGFVFAFNPQIGDNKEGINQINIAFGYTKTNDFNFNSIAMGDNSSNSIMDYFAARANDLGINSNSLSFGYDENGNTTYDPFRESNAPWDIIMAWNTYLIDTVSNGYNALLLPGDGVSQSNETQASGHSGEFNFSTAINISNKVYLGAVVGIVSHTFEQNIVYKEDAFSSNPSMNNGNRFYYSDYIQNVETNASGVNMKIGAIYTPIKPLRIGLAIHTPTFFNVEHRYSYQMKSNVDVNSTEQNYEVKSPAGKYDYDFETPFKFIGSVSYIIANMGLISVDVERLDYSSMKFRNGGDGDNLSDLNISASNTYRSTTNIKVGAEVMLGQMALRAGYAFYPSPYKNGFINDDAKTQLISGGIGYNAGIFFADAAYQQYISTENYTLYNYGDIYTNTVETEKSRGSFLLTFGFRF